MAKRASLGGKIDAEGGLKFLQHLFRTGNSYGLAVTQRGSGANLSVDIAAGGGMCLTSSDVPYYGWSTAVENLGGSASDPSNPRRDIVVMFINLANITSATTNNVDAFSFAYVPGTAAASPTDPNDAAIQSIVGAGNPWKKLARVRLPAAASSIVDAYIDDLREPMAVTVPYLWGGASNTKGHVVPNAADDTVTLNNATQTLTNKTLSAGANNTVSSAVLVNPYKFRATCTVLNSPAATANRIPFNSEVFDTSNNYDAVTNYRFTAPLTGFYQFNARLSMNNPGVAFLLIPYKNGVSFSRGSHNDSSTVNGIVWNDLVQMTAGDYIEVWLFTSTGGFIESSSESAAYFSGFLVSR